jgi:hypothetical protein
VRRSIPADVSRTPLTSTCRGETLPPDETGRLMDLFPFAAAAAAAVPCENGICRVRTHPL